MRVSGKIETQIVDGDEDVVYASPTDVFAHIRNKAYSDLTNKHAAGTVGETSLTRTDVRKLLRRFTDKIDNQTKRAWRRRRVEAYEVRIEFLIR